MDMRRIFLALWLLLPCVLVGWFFKELAVFCTRPVSGLTVQEVFILILVLAYPLRRLLRWFDKLDGK